jgi:hypothetical protein
MDTQAVSERAGQKPAYLSDTKPSLPKGARVSNRHYRYIRQGGKPKLIRYMRNDLHPADPLPRGGKTECTIQVGDELFRGVAVCAQTDVFCYRIGSIWALSYALQAYYQAHPTLKSSGASA